MSDKCVVVHSGARDQYQVALALAEKGMLEKLVTDFYCPDLLTSVFPKLKAKTYKDGLSSKYVSISEKALWAKTVMKARKDFSLSWQKDDALSAKTYRVAKNTGSHLFCYSYYAAHAFRLPRGFPGQKKILFQLHPHPYSVRKVLEEELVNVPSARASILYENEFQYSELYLNQLASEATMADAIVVASNYTRTTLISNGVDKDKISVVPYGIDSNVFNVRQSAPTSNKLRVVFVGSMVQRKGLSYLLEAVRIAGTEKIELVLCGRGFMDENLLSIYNDIDFVIKRNLCHSELVSELHESDVFVLPTLSEGFAQVILEAMACGIPVISTENSCAPDIITDGKEGFIIPIKNAKALAQKLDLCINNRANLFQMGQAAAERARMFSWEKFRAGITDFYTKALLK